MTINPSITDRLKTQHQAVENILSITGSDRLLTRPKPDKWNIHDNIAHLTRYQLIFIDRVNQILLSEEPSFGRYVAEEDPEFESYRSLEIGNLIKKLHEDRERIYGLITNLTDPQINRVGIHKKFGLLNIEQWTEFFLLHEAHHIYTIFQLAHDREL